jgi:aminopeptidase N
VARYDYKFDLATAMAESKLTLDVAAPGGDCWSVSSELAPLTDASWSGIPALAATQDGGLFKVCGKSTSGPTLEIGARATVPGKKWFNLDVGYSKKQDLAGGSFTYLLSWVGGCDRFGPCDDDPSRMSDFHFEVTHPAGTVVLCPGTLGEGSSTMTTCDVAGAPTYSAFAIAADPLWEKAPLGTFAGVDIVFYEVPGGKLASSLDVTKVGAFMDWITSLLGPFPYGNELRVAGGPTAWLGFEHPANIVLREDLDALQTSYQDGLMHVFMHEVIHQWAGDRTTLAEAGDFVWKEAIAEYLAYVFEDEAISPEAGAATRAYWDGISLQSQHWPRPTDSPAPEVQTFYGDVYGPGPMVLFVQLEPVIGRAAVLAGIADFLSKPGGRSVFELRDALMAASTKNLVPYFDAWVFGSGAPTWPTFQVATSANGGDATISLKQTDIPPGVLFPCEVEVEVKGATLTERVAIRFGLENQSLEEVKTIPFPEPITSVMVDPDHRLIGRSEGTPIQLKKPVWIF